MMRRYWPIETVVGDFVLVLATAAITFPGVKTPACRPESRP